MDEESSTRPEFRPSPDDRHLSARERSRCLRSRTRYTHTTHSDFVSDVAINHGRNCHLYCARAVGYERTLYQQEARVSRAVLLEGAHGAYVERIERVDKPTFTILNVQ